MSEVTGEAGYLARQVFLARTLGSEAAAVAVAQKECASVLRRSYVPHEKRLQICLLLRQAVSNAWRYGNGSIGIRFIVTGARCTMFLAYATERFDPLPRRQLISRMEEAGRGLAIMNHLASDLVFQFLPASGGHPAGVVVGLEYLFTRPKITTRPRARQAPAEL